VERPFGVWYLRRMASSKSSGKKETPLMKQYNQIKAQYPGAVLLFRVGDFYETFDADARIASKVLGIILTKRSNGAASEMDLAGFPHHSLDTYLPKLVRAGYRVAICDQLEDPKQVKGIVKRGVTELVTPGVSYNDKILESNESNFLASLHVNNGTWGLSLLDISTGDFQCTEGDLAFIKKMVSSFRPKEFVFSKNNKSIILQELGPFNSFQLLDDWVYQIDFALDKLLQQFKTQSLKGYGIQGLEIAITAAGGSLYYLEQTHHHQTGHLQDIRRLDESDYVWLDGFTIRNLELVRPIYPEGHALIDIIDSCSTLLWEAGYFGSGCYCH
jgi:DNA mismatch repair protein MutS